MTTMPPVGAGSVTPLPADPMPAAHDQAADLSAGHGPDTAGPGGVAGSFGALFGAAHQMHSAGQQQYVKQGGTQGAETKVKHERVPDADTRAYDVGTVSKDDIEALKNSPDKQQQRLGHAIENLKESYGDLLDSKQVKITVTMNAGNGGEPVATIASSKLDLKDPDKVVRVHTHYHGDNATIGDPEGSKAGQASRIREIIARDPQTVFVLPECRTATPTVDGPKHNNSYVAKWDNVKSQVETTEGALRAAGINPWKVGQETVSFHSRGGEVIQKLMQDDKTGNSLRADRLELLDCLYGSPPSVVAWGHTDNGKKVGHVIYVQGTNVASGYGDDSQIRKTFKGHTYIRIDVKGPLSEEKDKVVYEGKDAAREDHVKGETHKHAVRQYDTNAHYQTTGRYLGIWPLPLANG